MHEKDNELDTPKKDNELCKSNIIEGKLKWFKKQFNSIANAGSIFLECSHRLTEKSNYSSITEGFILDNKNNYITVPDNTSFRDVQIQRSIMHGKNRKHKYSKTKYSVENNDMFVGLNSMRGKTVGNTFVQKVSSYHSSKKSKRKSIYEDIYHITGEKQSKENDKKIAEVLIDFTKSFSSSTDLLETHFIKFKNKSDKEKKKLSSKFLAISYLLFVAEPTRHPAFRNSVGYKKIKSEKEYQTFLSREFILFNIMAELILVSKGKISLKEMLSRNSKYSIYTDKNLRKKQEKDFLDKLVCTIKLLTECEYPNIYKKLKDDQFLHLNSTIIGNLLRQYFSNGVVTPRKRPYSEIKETPKKTPLLQAFNSDKKNNLSSKKFKKGNKRRKTLFE